MELTKVDEAYELKMAAFEVDCKDGKGEPIACHNVAEFFSVVKDQFDKSAKIYEKNCNERGYGPSCFNLARQYMGGKGVVQNDATAENYFAKACEKHHLQGCYFHSLLLYGSNNNNNNNSSSNSKTNASTERQFTTEQAAARRAQSLKQMDWACKEGEFESCYTIGSHYLSSKQQQDKNVRLAVDYLERSCGANHAPSCFNLAVLYKHGDGGIAADMEKFERYKQITDVLVKQQGGLRGRKTA